MKIENKIDELCLELERIRSAKQSLIDQLNQIDIRTHQIVGALQVLEQLKEEINDEENSIIGHSEDVV